jgi:hypothetical protein
MAGLRVIVGDGTDQGPRSALWRVFTGRKTSDVYIGARPIAGEIRVSLHERGPWRFAYTEQHQRGPRSFVPLEEDRARYKWARPAEFAPGLTRAFIIVVASSELRAPRDPDPLKKPAVWLPPPPDGSQVEIDLFFARNARPGSWPGKNKLGTQLLYRQLLPNGEELMVVSHVVATSAEIRDKLDGYKRAMVRALDEAVRQGVHDGSDARAVLFSVPGENPSPDLAGVCAFYDVAVPSLSAIVSG